MKLDQSIYDKFKSKLDNGATLSSQAKHQWTDEDGFDHCKISFECFNTGENYSDSESQELSVNNHEDITEKYPWLIKYQDSDLKVSKMILPIESESKTEAFEFAKNYTKDHQIKLLGVEERWPD